MLRAFSRLCRLETSPFSGSQAWTARSMITYEGFAFSSDMERVLDRQGMARMFVYHVLSRADARTFLAWKDATLVALYGLGGPLFDLTTEIQEPLYSSVESRLELCLIAVIDGKKRDDSQKLDTIVHNAHRPLKAEIGTR